MGVNIVQRGKITNLTYTRANGMYEVIFIRSQAEEDGKTKRAYRRGYVTKCEGSN